MTKHHHSFPDDENYVEYEDMKLDKKQNYDDIISPCLTKHNPLSLVLPTAPLPCNYNSRPTDIILLFLNFSYHLGAFDLCSILIPYCKKKSILYVRPRDRTNHRLF